MKSVVVGAVFGLLGAANSNEICHTQNGTSYGEKGVVAYTESNHGPDGSLFLDPFFKSEIENIRDMKILDAGCGAAPWAIYAAKNGGDVHAIDIQEGMVEMAKKAVAAAKLSHRVKVEKGDVAQLPYENDFFDKQISICVACNLPPESFERHFLEFRRTLKENGTAIIGAPNSLDVAFSNGTKSEAEIVEHIQEILAQLPDNPSADLISEQLTKLNEVLSATFYIKNNRLTLVTNEKDLAEGQPIWRKLPRLVVPNRYYSKNYYATIFKKYNFEVTKVQLPQFKCEEDRLAYNKNAPLNSNLGKEYVAHSPFVIYHIKKKLDFVNERNVVKNSNFSSEPKSS